MKSKVKTEVFNVPNLLSVFRILLIPLFVWTLFAEIRLDHETRLTSAAILMLSGITDMLDGYIARQYKKITDLGKIIDPLADKLTQIAVAVCLLFINRGFVYILIILIVKEALMLIGGVKLLRGGNKVNGSKWFGKLATIVFYVLMLLVVAFPGLSSTAVTFMLCTVCVCMVFSFFMYIPVYLKQNPHKK